MRPSFTLIELLMVIAIIAILGGILLAAVGQEGTISPARDAKRVSDLKAMKDALELYVIDNHVYPADAAGLSALIPNYIPALPSDPLHNSPGECDSNFGKDERFPSAVSDNTDYGYRYLASADRLSFVLQACLKNDNTRNKVLDVDCDDASLDPPCFDSGADRIYDIHS